MQPRNASDMSFGKMFPLLRMSSLIVNSFRGKAVYYCQGSCFADEIGGLKAGDAVV